MFKPLLRVGAVLGRRQPFASLGAATGRFLRCTSGICSVEFVIVLGPFLMICFGIIGFALVNFAHNNMVNAAREATRRLSVAEDTVTAQNSTVACGSGALAALVTAAAPLRAAEEVACDYLAGWSITFNVTASECLTPANRDVTVRITTLASDAFMVDWMGFFQNNDLVAEVTMRREAECPLI